METLFVETLKVLLTVVLSAAVTGIWLQRWRYREDYIDKRLDDLIGEVEHAADLASAYWRASPGNAAVSSEIKLTFEDQEAALISRQMRIATLRCAVTDFLPQGAKELFIREGELFRAFTGGEFASSNRVCDEHRLQNVRQEAALYIGELRKMRRARLDANWLARLRN